MSFSLIPLSVSVVSKCFRKSSRRAVSMCITYLITITILNNPHVVSLGHTDNETLSIIDGHLFCKTVMLTRKIAGKNSLSLLLRLECLSHISFGSLSLSLFLSPSPFLILTLFHPIYPLLLLSSRKGVLRIRIHRAL